MMRQRILTLLCVLAALTLLAAGVCAEAAAWTCPNCGAAAPSAEAQNAEPSGQEEQGPEVDEHLEQIPGETDRVKVRPESVDASSYIVNKSDPDRWLPENAADGNETTCWQFSAKKGLKGKSWLDLIVGEPETEDEIWFKNGFWAYNDKGEDQYPINARLKKVRVEFLYFGEEEYLDAVDLTLKDESRTGWQVFPVGRHDDVVAVRIAIHSTYAGSTYKNHVCLSEVMLVREAPASIAMPPSEAQQAVVYDSRPEITGVPLLMKLATRSGPGTQYDEPGTFFPKTWKKETVRVLGKSYDGSVWWVLVDFNNSGKASYRVWTGLKRVDVDLSKLKEIYPAGQGTVDATSETYRGPGGKYAKAKVTISSWVDVLAFGRENGYVEVEFEQGRKTYRLWVPEKVAHIDWGNDNSGEN